MQTQFIVNYKDFQGHHALLMMCEEYPSLICLPRLGRLAKTIACVSSEITLSWRRGVNMFKVYEGIY